MKQKEFEKAMQELAKDVNTDIIRFPLQNYLQLFFTEDAKNTVWLKKQNALAIAMETDKIGLRKSYLKRKYEKEYGPVDFSRVALVNLIDVWTMGKNEDNQRRFEQFSKRISSLYGYAISETDKKLTISRNNMPTIGVSRISDHLPDNSGYVTDEKNSLQTEERFGHCHEHSILLCSAFDNSSTIVTGYASSNNGNTKFLHSWLELDKFNVCMDGNLNAIINKEGYYYLYHPEILTTISKEELQSDIESELFRESIDLKDYCVFRHELAKQHESSRNE